jgi:hypothetical protein
VLTVTQLCPSCGRRVAADRTCSTCAPSVGRTLAVGLRATALFGSGLLAVAFLLELL